MPECPPAVSQCLLQSVEVDREVRSQDMRGGERRTRGSGERDGIGRQDGKIKTGNAILYYDAENSRDRD